MTETRDPSTRGRKRWLAVGAALAAATVAQAQTGAPPDGPQPYARVQTPPTAPGGALSDSDAQGLRAALDSARRGDLSGARNAISGLVDPVARLTATWALVDANSDSLSFFELDQARRDLAGWPRATRRQAAAEKLLETSGQGPAQIIAWFGGAEPQTPEGAAALAGALRAQGQAQPAAELIRRTWRSRMFDADLQRSMLARFGDLMTADDHARRVDLMLYGSHGAAAKDMLPLLSDEDRRLALARMALRSGAGNAAEQTESLSLDATRSPGLAFERAALFRRRGMDIQAITALRRLPPEHAAEVGARVWDERYQLTLSAIKTGDWSNAYLAAADSGLLQGADAAEAEFYAGWIALTRLNNPGLADKHFTELEKIGTSPITRGRALYWRGRAAEAMSQPEIAEAFFGAAAAFPTTFYGQLAAERLGRPLVLGKDPEITEADRARFDSRAQVRAARQLMQIGARDQFRVFVLSLDDILPTAAEEALLVDLARSYGELETSMKVVRSAAQRGFILPERGYPVRTPPDAAGAPEQALILGITRQESGFDPGVRSAAGARGMMQLMPATASILARRMGVSYSASKLEEPEYNMRLGSTYLGNLIDGFSGSYVMGIAGYNAGPGRPAAWSAFCGDPRGAGTDPVDFIECIPFSETRNYVMRVMEGMQVYRARLNGGAAPITLRADLRRGGYGSTPTPVASIQGSGR